MFIGHFAVGFAAKRAAPRANLGVLLAAPLLADLLWPLFLLAGWERVRIEPGNTAFTPLALDFYPYTHSLVMMAAWGGLFAALYWWRTRYRAGAIAIAVGVVSHWVLDWVTHRPDLPLWPGHSPLLGMGLWNSVAGTIVVESSLFAGAIWLYTSRTRAQDGVGRWALGALFACLALLYVAAVMGPVPPSVRALEITGLVAWIFPFWAGWADRHRTISLPPDPLPAAP